MNKPQRKMEIMYDHDLLALREVDHAGDERESACARCPWGPPCSLLGQTSSDVIVIEQATHDPLEQYVGGATNIFRCAVQRNFPDYDPAFAAFVTPPKPYSGLRQLTQWGQSRDIDETYRPGSAYPIPETADAIRAALRIKHFDFALTGSWAEWNQTSLEKRTRAELLGMLFEPLYRDYDRVGSLEWLSPRLQSDSSDELRKLYRWLHNECYRDEGVWIRTQWRMTQGSSSSKMREWANEIIYHYLHIQASLAAMKLIAGELSARNSPVKIERQHEFGPEAIKSAPGVARVEKWMWQTKEGAKKHGEFLMSSVRASVDGSKNDTLSLSSLVDEIIQLEGIPRDLEVASSFVPAYIGALLQGSLPRKRFIQYQQTLNGIASICRRLISQGAWRNLSSMRGLRYHLLWYFQAEAMEYYFRWLDSKSADKLSPMRRWCEFGLFIDPNDGLFLQMKRILESTLRIRINPTDPEPWFDEQSQSGLRRS